MSELTKQGLSALVSFSRLYNLRSVHNPHISRPIVLVLISLNEILDRRLSADIPRQLKLIRPREIRILVSNDDECLDLSGDSR